MEPLAAQALIAARGALASGADQIGQRQLEVLIARYPETRAAAEARRLLAVLYAQLPAPQPTRVTEDAPAVVERPPSVVQLSALDRQLVRSLADDLRMSAGDRLFFQDRSIDLPARARLTVRAQAEWLLRHPELPVVVEGHADDTVGAVEMGRLATARAEAVRDLLVEAGIDRKRVAVRGLGDSDRLVRCREPACAAQNRRVLVIVEDRPGRPGTRTGQLGAGTGLAR